MKGLSILLPLALTACTSVSEAPILYSGSLAAEGTAVPISQAVGAAGIALTPMAVVEDSRCPINARCVWAGRIVVTTRIDGPGWRETRNLELGKPQTVRDYRVALVSAEPGKTAGQETVHSAYRFVFTGERVAAAR